MAPCGAYSTPSVGDRGWLSTIGFRTNGRRRVGYYIGANEISRGYANRESIELASGLRRFRNWDVFVSHKSDDTVKAIQIAERISSNGLSAWVDVADPTGVRDGPELADYIRQILASSRSLLAVTTSATKESWWVPFEIGIAFQQQIFLASYGSRASLPSFLIRWPNLQNVSQVDRWCRELGPLPHGVTYTSRMRTLATRF